MTIKAVDSGADIPRQAERRDGRALAHLYDRYGRLLYSAVLRIVRNQAVAEDLVHEAFLRVWNRAQNRDALKDSLGAWLLVAARNRALEYVRFREGGDSAPAVSEVSEDPRLCARLETAVPFAERARRTKLAVAELPEGQRRLIELACIDGLSLTDVAAKSGHPVDTVKTLLRTALAGLRKAVEAEVCE